MGWCRGGYHPHAMACIITAYAAGTLFSDGAENREKDAFAPATHAYTAVYHHPFPAKTVCLTIPWLVYM